MPSVVPNTLEDSIHVKYHSGFFLHLFIEISDESQRTEKFFRITWGTGLNVGFWEPSLES